MTASLRSDLLSLASLIQPAEKVLDLGCGDGELLKYLLETKHITARGVELSEDGALACLQNGLSVRQGDLHEGLGDYPAQSFDTVILSYTIPYLNDPANVLHEMLRVGKRALLSFPNWGYWHCRFDLLLRGRVPAAEGLPGDLDTSPRPRPLTIADFEHFCAGHDLHITQRLFLCGGRVISPLAANWRAATAIFELR